MKRLLCTFALGLLGVWTAAAQSSASAQAGASAQSHSSAQVNKSGAQASGNDSVAASASAKAAKSSANLADGTKIDATLVNPLDVKHNKAGDRVEARTTQDVKQDGNVVLKKGTILVGHVTQAQARANGQPQSQLGVAFDRAIAQKGQEIPFSASIKALAVSRSATIASAGSDGTWGPGTPMGSPTGGARSGGLVNGVASTTGATAGTVMNTSSPVSTAAGATLKTTDRSAGAVGGLTAAGQLSSNSSGVFGLQGLSLDSAASSATQGSLIVSSTKNIHLDTGTQLLLSISGHAK